MSNEEYIEIEMTYFIDWFWSQDSKTQELWDTYPNLLMRIFLMETEHGTLDRFADTDGSRIDSNDG